MKNLYSRVVLFFIRPALHIALRHESRQGGVLWKMQTIQASVTRNANSYVAGVATASSAGSRDLVRHPEGS